MGDTVVLSWGMGVDSTALLLRWLAEPQRRGFRLEDLVVLVAMTGDEYPDTGVLAEAHVLPALAAEQVRLVQVARQGPHRADGFTVLDDSRSPTRLHLSGRWRLSDELAAAGTVPQVAANRRICSTKFKGEVLDDWIDRNVTGPYRHVLGFNADEGFRVERDASYARPGRRSEYPLLGWGWGRAEVEDYLAAVCGVAWPKSCCTMCPFAGSSGGLAATLTRWAADPATATAALLLEHTALALNPKMALFGSRRAVDVVDDATRARFAAELDGTPHALYEVRRILPHRRGDPTRKAPGWRSVRTIAVGTRSALRADLGRGADTDRWFARRYLERRADHLPTREHLLTVAPVGVVDKARPGFERQWAAVAAPRLFAA